MSTNSLLKKAVTTHTYSISTETMKAMIASDLGIDSSEINVQYVLGDIGLGDPMDRYPAPRGVVEVKVIHTKK